MLTLVVRGVLTNNSIHIWNWTYGIINNLVNVSESTLEGNTADDLLKLIKVNIEIFLWLSINFSVVSGNTENT